MAARTHTPDVIEPPTGGLDKHPRGFYVRFATEMWKHSTFWIVLSGPACDRGRSPFDGP